MLTDLTDYLSESPQRLFWLDSAGAFSSAFIPLLGWLLFGPSLGLSIGLIATMMAFGLLYGWFSLGCSLLIDKRWKLALQILIVLNSLYLLFLLSIMILNAFVISKIYLVLMIFEALTLASLIYLEIQVYQRLLKIYS